MVCRLKNEVVGYVVVAGSGGGLNIVLLVGCVMLVVFIVGRPRGMSVICVTC